ncbi:transcriptional activator FtrA [compost metagenome]
MNYNWGEQMGIVMCLISEEFADFEITLVLHKLRNAGGRQICSVTAADGPVTSESGLTYMPDLTIAEVMELEDIEGLIIPGGPIRNQPDGLTELIRKLDREKRLLAAICNGPQYLGRAGILDQRKFTTSCSAERIRKLGVQDPFPRWNDQQLRVVRDGHIITAHGRAFVDFSFAIFDYLAVYQGREEEQELLYKEIMGR